MVKFVKYLKLSLIKKTELDKDAEIQELKKHLDYIPRAEAEGMIGHLTQKINDLENARNSQFFDQSKGHFTVGNLAMKAASMFNKSSKRRRTELYHKWIPSEYVDLETDTPDRKMKSAIKEMHKTMFENERMDPAGVSNLFGDDMYVV